MQQKYKINSDNWSNPVFSSCAANKFENHTHHIHQTTKRARNYSNKRLCVLKELIITTFSLGAAQLGAWELESVSNLPTHS